MSDKDDDILQTAKDRYKLAISRAEHNRERQKQDIRFAAASPDDPWQWDDTLLSTRRGDQRPTLTINKLPLHIRQVTNDMRMNRPQVRYRPADDKSDPEVAEILNSLVRHIEAHSQADMAYDVCAFNQVTSGEGYFRVLTDYVSEDSFDQDIFIRRIDDPFRVHLDPDRLDWAGSDAKWGFIDDDISEDEFKKEYPDADPIDWTFVNDVTWFTSDKRVRIAEYFEVEEEELPLYLWANGATSFKGDPMPDGVYMGEQPIKERKSCKRKVIWRKINGQQVLEKKEFPCKYIPIVCAVGNVWTVDGKKYISGLVRNAKDSQRMYNVAQSAIVERVLLAPKAPWVAPAEAIQGYEPIWQNANAKAHSFLPYNHVDESGAPIPAPTRTQPATVEPGLNQIAMGASDDIKAETGQFDASLGQKSNETSGRAIMARQREGDMATYHFVDNFAQAVRQLGVIILDMIPRVYDTRRVAKILGEDGDAATAILDPKAPQALQKVRDDETQEIQRIFNPNVGFYDVYTTTGPSFTTRRVESVEAMTQLLQTSPDLWKVIGDQFVKAQDWPGAEDMSERLKLILLPEVQKKISQEEDVQIPPQVEQELSQMQQMLKQFQQALQNADTMLEEAKAKEASREDENRIKAYEAETKRLQVLGTTLTPEAVQALTVQTVMQMMRTPDPMEEHESAESPQWEAMEHAPPGGTPMEMIEQPPSGGFSLSGQ